MNRKRRRRAMGPTACATLLLASPDCRPRDAEYVVRRYELASCGSIGGGLPARVDTAGYRLRTTSRPGTPQARAFCPSFTRYTVRHSTGHPELEGHVVDVRMRTGGTCGVDVAHMYAPSLGSRDDVVRTADAIARVVVGLAGGELPARAADSLRFESSADLEAWCAALSRGAGSRCTAPRVVAAGASMHALVGL